jgi:mRNA interferase RelE/StbE
VATVLLIDDAKQDLRSLDGSARVIVAKALKKLADHPELRGQPLGSPGTGDLTTFRKLVVGDRQYRVVYRVEPDGSVCVVWVIGPRSDSEVYNVAVARLAAHADPAKAKAIRALIDLACRKDA